MSKAGISFEEMKTDMLKDEEFKIEYEKLKPRYEAIEQIIRARKEQNITQAELAKMIGSKQQAISRLESKEHSPSLKLFYSLLDALGYELTIEKKATV